MRNKAMEKQVRFLFSSVLVMGVFLALIIGCTPCALECTGSWSPMTGMGGTPSVTIEITCESGEYTSSMKSMRAWDDQKGWVTHIEETRTYKKSGNEYKIVASAYPYVSGDSPIMVGYHVEVTGGAFGEIPKICSSD
jgi:hypothetical protein